jgi:hypothetical protein
MGAVAPGRHELIISGVRFSWSGAHPAQDARTRLLIRDQQVVDAD